MSKPPLLPALVAQVLAAEPLKAYPPEPVRQDTNYLRDAARKRYHDRKRGVHTDHIPKGKP